MSDFAQLAPAAPRHQAPVTQSTKSALGGHQVVIARPPPSELVQPTHALSRITPYRTMELPGGEVLREFWKIGCAPTRSMRSALNYKDVARQCAFITVSGDRQSFRLGFFPSGESGQVVENLPISRLPEAVDQLLDAGFAGMRASPPTGQLRIS